MNIHQCIVSVCRRRDEDGLHGWSSVSRRVQETGDRGREVRALHHRGDIEKGFWGELWLCCAHAYLGDVHAVDREDGDTVHVGGELAGRLIGIVFLRYEG